MELSKSVDDGGGGGGPALLQFCVDAGIERKWKGSWNLYVPDNRGPWNVPPIIGMTMRSCPFGTGPRENLSPSSASMLYIKFNCGGEGGDCAIVAAASELAARLRVVRKCMLIKQNSSSSELCMELAWESGNERNTGQAQ